MDAASTSCVGSVNVGSRRLPWSRRAGTQRKIMQRCCSCCTSVIASSIPCSLFVPPVLHLGSITQSTQQETAADTGTRDELNGASVLDASQQIAAVNTSLPAIDDDSSDAASSPPEMAAQMDAIGDTAGDTSATHIDELQHVPFTMVTVLRLSFLVALKTTTANWHSCTTIRNK